ncbi:MAG: hypothetical protein RLZZ256_1009 [Bacteroidota bacterium]|jgi:hypothetical protein
MSASPESLYSIPARFRRMENMHIVFWLLKDISWCLFWRELGIAMIIPTLTIAIMISWRTRHIASELAHNLAVAFWISANSFWMISEFLEFDEKIVILGINGKQLSLIPFLAGLLILLNYYLLQRPREVREKHTTTL